MEESKFPTKRVELHDHLSNVVPRLNSEKVRMGIVQEKLDDLNAAYGDLLTLHTYLYLYKQWKDPTKRTSPATDELGRKEEEVKQMIMDIYDNTIPDVWNDDDRAIFNRKKGLPRAIPVQHHTPIPEDVFYKIEPLPNGEFEFVCRSVEDSTKASLPEGADGVEVIFDLRVYERTEGSPELSSIPKKLPTNVNECPFKDLFFKARFTMKTDPANVGKYIVAYTRWINSRHPEAAGKWSGPQAADVR